MLMGIKSRAYNLLKRSERIFKTDMSYLARGGSWLLTSQIFVSFSSFLLAIAFAHFLPKETYGEYKYILSIAGILGTFTLTGLGGAVIRSVSQGREGSLRYAFWENIRWSALFCLVSLGIAIYYFSHGNTSLGISMLVVGSLSPVISSTNLYGSFLVGKKDFRRTSLYYDILGNLFPTGVLLLTMLITIEPLWLIVAYFASNTLIGLVLYYRVVKIYQPNHEVDSEILNYGKHLSVMNVLAGVSSNIDQILVFHFIGAAELAIYNFAIAIPNQLKGPIKGLSNLIFPKFVEREDREIKSGINHKFLLLLVAGIIAAGAYILAAPYIFKMFFPQYTSSIWYSQIFAISLLNMISIPADTYLTAKKKIAEQYASTITISLSQIIIIPLSIIYGGLLGLVTARVVIRLLDSAVSIFLYRFSTRNVVP